MGVCFIFGALCGLIASVPYVRDIMDPRRNKNGTKPKKYLVVLVPILFMIGFAIILALAGFLMARHFQL